MKDKERLELGKNTGQDCLNGNLVLLYYVIGI